MGAFYRKKRNEHSIKNVFFEQPPGENRFSNENSKIPRQRSNRKRNPPLVQCHSNQSSGSAWNSLYAHIYIYIYIDLVYIHCTNANVHWIYIYIFTCTHTSTIEVQHDAYDTCFCNKNKQFNSCRICFFLNIIFIKTDYKPILFFFSQKIVKIRFYSSFIFSFKKSVIDTSFFLN